MRVKLFAVLIFQLVGWNAAGFLPAQPAEANAQTRFSVDVNLVTLRFSVRDEQGDFINGLKAGDFAVTENGRRQEIRIFEPPRSPEPVSGTTWLAFLLDVSGSTLATRNEEILAARRFFENIRDSVQVGVFGFTDELISFQPFTDDRQKILEAFAEANNHKGRTALYHAAQNLLAQMNSLSQPGDRKVIIVLSDGEDDDFQESGSAAALARESSTVFYTVWVPSASLMYSGSAVNDNERMLAEREKKKEAYATLATATGGRYFGGFEAILDFDDVMAQINEEVFGNLYTVGYYSELRGRGKGDRNIILRLTGEDKEDYRIRGLYQNLPDLVQSKKRFIEALFDSSAPAPATGKVSSFRDFGVDIDLRKASFSEGIASVPFRIKISPFTLPLNKDGNIDTQFGYVGMLSDSAGEEALRLRGVFSVKLTRDQIMDEGRGILYNGSFRIPPGRYFFRLAVLRIPTWEMTVVDKILQVHEPGG